MIKIDEKLINEKVDYINKHNQSITIFSEGLTILHGSEEHCICSIAWSLNSLRKQNNEVYTKILYKLAHLMIDENKEE